VLLLALRNLARRPLRNGLTVLGLTIALATLISLRGFEKGYNRALHAELDRMGVQLMLVPLGCPYDAAARVLKGIALENTLPESALTLARQDPAVQIAAPLFTAAFARPNAGRADMWVGVDETALQLKPWWHISSGQAWFADERSVILGADAAELEMRSPGDQFLSHETGKNFRVAGVLQRSGTSDDSLFFVPLPVAQKMFGQEGRLTAVAIRLKDPELMAQASRRLQQIPGAQVVTLAEMNGVFLNLVGSARTLMFAIALIALGISGLTVFNTVLAGVVERASELAVLRAVGASRFQVIALVTAETALMAMVGALCGVIMAWALGSAAEQILKQILPLAPAERLLLLSPGLVAQATLWGLLVAVVGGLYPAWRAGQVAPASALRN